MSDNLFSNWVIENSATIGTGPIILSGALGVNQARFRDAVNSGNVYYSLTSGANRECGIGVFNGSNQITRTDVRATLVNGTYNDNNPSPINLEGEAVVSGTLNADLMHDVINDLAALLVQVEANTQDLVVIGEETTALGVRVTVNEADIAVNASDIADNAQGIIDNAQDLAVLDRDVSFRESAVTALENGGLVSQNGATAVIIAPGNGEIIDSYSDTEDQATEDISWSELAFDLLANGGMPAVTGLGLSHIGIESVSGVATARAYPNGMSDSQRRNAIRLCRVEYTDRVITSVIMLPIVSNQVGNTLLDFISFTPQGARLKGMVLRPTNIGDLSIWRDSGTVFAVGVNFYVTKANPNIGVIAAAGAEDTAIPFRLVSYNNGSTGLGAEVLTIPSDLYEPNGAGSIDILGNGKTSIHYIYESLSGARFMSYGQQSYDSYAEAVTNLFADRSSHLVPVELQEMILLGQAVILKDTATWGATAEIFPLDSATSSGSSSGSASQAVNIAYSDTFNLGSNVQAAIDTLAGLKLTPAQHDALAASQVPSGTNEFITKSALADGSVPIEASTLDGLDSSEFLQADGSITLVGDLLVDAGVEIDGRDLSVDGLKLDTIEAGATGDQSAAQVPFTPVGNIAATDTQAAIAEAQVNSEAADAALQAKIDILNAKTGRNLIINGDFSIWERGDSFLLGVNSPGGANQGYTADRWFGVMSDAAIDRIENASTDGQGPAWIEIILLATAQFSHLRQGIEWSNQFAPQSKWTVSYEARSSDGGILEARIAITDNIAALTNLMPLLHEGIVALTPTFVKHEFTFEIPLGVPIQAEMLVVNFNNVGPEETNYSVRNVQLEEGEIASDFEVVQVGDQLARCQRYGFHMNKNNVLGSGYTNNAPTGVVHMYPPVSLRGVPVLEDLSGDGLTFNFRDDSGVSGQTGLDSVAVDTPVLKFNFSGGALQVNKPITVTTVASFFVNADYV